MVRITHKVAFLVASGLPERDAKMAMLVSGRFTVGCVLEEQMEAAHRAASVDSIGVPQMDHEAAFEDGLQLILDGLGERWSVR
jgi:TetR/AcrR family transcriptional regulator, tetracycline repressor protein